MSFCRNVSRLLLTGVAALALPTVYLQAQTSEAGSHSAPVLVTGVVNAKQTTVMSGTVRADLSQHKDLGLADGNVRFNHFYVVLQRSAAQQADMDNYLEQLQQKGSGSYHKWLTPEQVGERYGLSTQDIAKVTNWLTSVGLTVNNVPHNGTLVDVGGTAAQLRTALGVEVHRFEVDGNTRFANVTEPRIPVALTGVIAGIQGLNNFPHHAAHSLFRSVSRQDGKWVHDTSSSNAAAPGYTFSDQYGTELDVAPQDMWTIYNVNPVFSGLTKGANATIAVAEESDINYGTVNSSTGAATGGDVATFRSVFGVNAQSSTFNFYVFHGYGSDKCDDPGVDPAGEGEDGEASLDAEWATALAPAAKLIFMSCEYSQTNASDDGIFTSLLALVDNNLADAISTSYGNSEKLMAASDFSGLDSINSEAALQGQSIIWSSGDSGSDVADQNTNYLATRGLNVSGFSASNLVTAAGGTDFQDLYDYNVCGGGTSCDSTVPWNLTTNTTYYGSALKYVPEKTWNDSCADSMLAVLLGASDPASSCNSNINSYGEGDVVGGSGGVSTHYSLPAYQKGITGLPSSVTGRAQPDISFFAGNGFWSHALLFCNSHADPGATAFPCTGAVFGEAGGTSFVAPQVAGMAGLLVSYTGERQGVLNYGLYALARAQYTGSLASSCYASGTSSNTGATVAAPSSSCTFYDVTGGNNSEPCAKNGLNCYASGSYGVLSTSTTSEAPAYVAGVGYDMATGIGSANVYNLINNWKNAFSTNTTLKTNATTVTTSQSFTLTATVAASVANGTTYGTATGTVTFKDTTNNTTLGTCTLTSQSCTLTVSGSKLATGSNSITATFGGSKEYPSSVSTAVAVTLSSTTATTTTAVSVSPSTSLTVGTTATLTATITASSGTASVGTVAFETNGITLGTANVSNGKAILTGSSAGLAAGSYSLKAVYSGGTGFSGSTSPAVNVTLNKATTKTTLATSTNSVTPPASVTLTATVTGGSAGTVTGTVTFSADGLALGTANVVSGKATYTASSNGAPAGTYGVVATYNGNSYYGGSTSSAQSITVK